MSDYKQTRDAAGRVTSTFGKMLEGLNDDDTMKLEDGLLEVVKIVEHEDGGATYTFDMTDGMSDICGSLGLKLLLYCGALDKSPTFVFDWLGLMLTEKQIKEEQLGQLVAEKHSKEK